jgi:hypothetical protein
MRDLDDLVKGDVHFQASKRHSAGQNQSENVQIYENLVFEVCKEFQSSNLKNVDCKEAHKNVKMFELDRIFFTRVTRNSKFEHLNIVDSAEARKARLSGPCFLIAFRQMQCGLSDNTWCKTIVGTKHSTSLKICNGKLKTTKTFKHAIAQQEESFRKNQDIQTHCS